MSNPATPAPETLAQKIEQAVAAELAKAETEVVSGASVAVAELESILSRVEHDIIGQAFPLFSAVKAAVAKAKAAS